MPELWGSSGDDDAPPEQPVRIVRWQGEDAPTRAELEDQLEEEGLVPWITRDDAGTKYDEHTHPDHEVRVVVTGAMRFNIGKREVLLEPGDRLDLAAGVPHAAEVLGEAGAEYLCASRAERD